MLREAVVVLRQSRQGEARNGHDVKLALLLRTSQATQQVMIEHRTLIIRELERSNQPSE